MQNVRKRIHPSSSVALKLHRVLSRPIPKRGIKFNELLRGVEHVLITKALAETNGNVLRAAALLGMRRDKLRYRMMLLGITTRNGHGKPAHP